MQSVDGTYQTNRINKDMLTILFTNDEHCHIDTGIGFAGVCAMKRRLKDEGKNVVLVSAGDIFQGQLFSLPTKGKLILDFFDRACYDFFTLGNHEFDYGMQHLGTLLAGLKNARCICSNLQYVGAKEDGGELGSVLPYCIQQYGNRKVAFIGVTTPDALNEALPETFTENGVCVYDFFGGEKPSINGLAKVVQKYTDICRGKGADTVVLISHLGNGNGLYNSKSLITLCHGIDLVLDGHDHKAIEGECCVSRDGKSVLLVSTGAMFENVARIDIAEDGKISSRFVENNGEKDNEIASELTALRAEIDDILAKKAGFTIFGLPTVSQSEARLVRCRETCIGNMCADACRVVCDTDIALINTGAIRTGLMSGNISYGDIMKIFPFGDCLDIIEVGGLDLLNALEVGCMRLLPLAESNGMGIGEFGGFPAVGGLNFKVDTSIPSPVKIDDANNFLCVWGKRRVSDVWLTDSMGRRYGIFDVGRKYTVACTEFTRSGGNGYTMFKKYKPLLSNRYTLAEVVTKVILDIFGGVIPQRYASIENRIVVE